VSNEIGVNRNFRIPDSEYLPSQERAAREGETMTDVVRRAIRAHGAGETEDATLADAIKRVLAEYEKRAS
jgi:hypothetical protein